MMGRHEMGQGGFGTRIGRRVLGGLALAAMSLLPGAAQAQSSLPIEPVELPAELDRVLRDYETAWRAGDEQGLAALFTENGFVMQNGRAAVRGREAIQQVYANSQGALYLSAWDFSVEGDTGFIIGGFALGPGDPEVGKFVLTLRRVGDRWFIHSDMDSPGARGG